MSDLFSRPNRKRGRNDGFRREDDELPKSDGGLIGWAIFIVLLVGLVALCWMGSLYIFGHPESPMSYSLLSKLHKIDPPERFLDATAPKGEFLDADKILERYGAMTPRELKKASAGLLRDYIQNYDSVKGLVPYVTGNFEILDSYQLTKNDFFTSGVVAVAQDSKKPQVLLENVFTAEEKAVPIVHRSLLTGLPITLEKTRGTRDLAAIINVQKLEDGRIKVTTVPINYPGYAATQGPGAFSLEPPKELNVEAGLPVISKSRQAEADAHYASYRRKLAGQPSAEPTEENASNQLVRIKPQNPGSGESSEPTVARATLANPGSEPTPAPTPAGVAAATPEPEVRAAIPVNGTPQAPTPPPAVAAAPTVGSDVPLKPFMPNQPAPAITSSGSGSWQTYGPGRMPRGRLVGLRDTKSLADTGLGGDPVYLEGDFVVTAAGPGRAVLRSTGSSAGAARVIVEFPAGTRPPGEGSNLSRGGQRPFLITNVKRGPDGTLNIEAREVTTE